MLVNSVTEPEKVLYIAHAGRAPEVLLRKNAEKVEDLEGNEQWRYEEHRIECDLTKEQVEAQFDMLWAAAERNVKTVDERVADVESITSDNAAALGELGMDTAQNSSDIQDIYAAIAEVAEIVAGGE